MNRVTLMAGCWVAVCIGAIGWAYVDSGLKDALLMMSLVGIISMIVIATFPSDMMK